MRDIFKIFIGCLILMSFSLYPQQTPQDQPTTNVPQAIQDSPLIQIDLEDFEQAEDWLAKPTSPLGETKTLKLVQRGEIRATDDENMRPPEGEALSVDVDPNNPNHVLGVKTYFVNRGFDRVEVKPPHPYVIKGKVRQFSIWVLGRNYRHTMYLKIRDYKGNFHSIKLGKLNFFGWRKFTVSVPGWIPQSTRFAMIDKNLQFISIYVVSDHHEVGGEFYFYVDGLKALVDRSELVYPGSEIKDNW
ncbi:MAG: flagellar filament outer layer protein FlaA [Leptospiraceae bacterium]|nr:flagellar filament outer layer protein FlaA [Leptospiraceae bacterium]MDW7976226.1 flagellar filament outer layer protein FlaA [Leptospiraceae bacterium]